MVARTWADIKDLESPSYAEIDSSANIHDSVRLEPYSVIEKDVTIGEGTLIGPFNHIRPNTIIGKNCKIGGHNTFEGSCEIGNRVRMGSHNNIGWGIIIGDDVFIAGHFTGGNDKLMLWPLEANTVFEPNPYRIMAGAKIGLASAIAPGVIVGYRAFIQMGSVVTRNVGRYERWGGPFAEKKGEIKEWFTTR